MNENKEPRRYGGGVFIAVGTIGGTIIGHQMGQTTIGILAGFVAGVGIALLIAMRNDKIA